MSELGLPLPLQLRQREIHGILPQLYTNLKHLQELIKDSLIEKTPSEISFNDFEVMMEERYNDKHALEISKILFWISTHHPDILADDSKVLSDISINCVYFRNSWDNMDELLPRDPLMTLLRSKVCKNLIKFCGYIDPMDLINAKLSNLKDIRLAIGRDNVHSFSDSFNSIFGSACMTIHLRCGEVDLEELGSLHYYQMSICISNVSDQDVDWVVQAIDVIRGNEGEEFNTIFLSHSTLTSIGIEDIAKGFAAAGIEMVTFTVSSPHFNNKVDYSMDNFFETIQQKYNLSCCATNDQDYEREFLEDVWPEHSETSFDF